MQITYANLVEEVQAKKQKELERKQKLQADATLLVQELKRCLYLPVNEYVDENNMHRPWLDVYVKNHNGLYESRPPQGLQTDKLHVLSFYVGLLLAGADIADEYAYVPVEMYYKGGSLIVTSGLEKSHVKVLHGSDQGRFYEAATMIKNSFVKAIKDPNLA